MTTESQIAAVVVAIYPSEDQSKAALKQLDDMQREGIIDLIEAAIVSKDDKGKVHVKDTADVGTRKGTRRGVIAGAVVGVIFPPSILVGAIGGGAIGGLYGHFRDKGMSNKELAQAGDDLQPGESGIIAVLVDRFVATAEQALEGYSKLNKTLLDAEASAAVIAEASKVELPETAAGETTPGEASSSETARANATAGETAPAAASTGDTTPTSA